ncbi:hypothetical protein MRX96_005214 [Rhipicephalus microplus]
MVLRSTGMAWPEVVGERWGIDRPSVVSFRCGRFYEPLEISMNKLRDDEHVGDEAALSTRWRVIVRICQAACGGRLPEWTDSRHTQGNAGNERRGKNVSPEGSWWAAVDKQVASIVPSPALLASTLAVTRLGDAAISFNACRLCGTTLHLRGAAVFAHCCESSVTKSG